MKHQAFDRSFNTFDFLYLILVSILVLTSCDNSINDKSKNPESMLAITSIDIDTLFLSEIPFTEEGFFRIRQDTLIYFDYKYLTASTFNKEGDFIQSHLGRGNGPKEITSFQYHGFNPKGESVFLGLSYDISFFTKNWEKAQLTQYLDWKRENKTYQESDLDQIGMYSFNFPNDPYSSKYLPVNSKDEFYMSLWISPGVSQTFHSYEGNIEYFKKSKAIGLADVKTGKVLKVFGNKPTQYLDFKTTPLFDFFNYDLRNDSLFVAFAVTDLIQVYDANQELAYEFGVKGTDMNQNYEGVSDIETAEKIWRKEFQSKGFYYHLYASEDGKVFRSYTKNDSLGGLQIYDGKQLIADVTVPKRFSIIGKIGDFYYADGLISEESDQLGIYRFKIPEN